MDRSLEQMAEQALIKTCLKTNVANKLFLKLTPHEENRSMNYIFEGRAPEINLSKNQIVLLFDKN